jgi:hypothetical protein
MSGHTPGPWRLDPYSGDSGYTVWGGGTAYRKGPRVLAIVKNQSSAPVNESRFNAHLIAASPDLLEVCKKAQAMIQFYRNGGIDVFALPPLDDELKAAIAKAEGRA